MPHGDAVINGNGVEFFGNRARRFDFARDQLPHVFEVDVTGDELGKAIDHGNDGFAEVAVFHAGRPPQSAGAGHIPSGGRGAGTVRDCQCHDVFLLLLKTKKPTAGGRPRRVARCQRVPLRLCAEGSLEISNMVTTSFTPVTRLATLAAASASSRLTIPSR